MVQCYIFFTLQVGFIQISIKYFYLIKSHTNICKSVVAEEERARRVLRSVLQN